MMRTGLVTVPLQHPMASADPAKLEDVAQAIRDSVSTAAVPKGRHTASLPFSCQNCAHLWVQSLRTVANQLICSNGDRDGPFRCIPKSQARYAQECGFLLDSA